MYYNTLHSHCDCRQQHWSVRGDISAGCGMWNVAYGTIPAQEDIRHSLLDAGGRFRPYTDSVLGASWWVIMWNIDKTRRTLSHLVPCFDWLLAWGAVIMIVLNFCYHYLCFVLYGVHTVLESKICPKCDKLCSFDKCFVQSDRSGSLCLVHSAAAELCYPAC